MGGDGTVDESSGKRGCYTTRTDLPGKELSKPIQATTEQHGGTSYDWYDPCLIADPVREEGEAKSGQHLTDKVMVRK